MSRALRCAAAVAAACLATPALAGELRVPEEYASIQAAVDAAVEGDVVLVGPGVYAESVAAVKSGITVRGRAARWDGGTDEEAAPCLSLVGDGNAVVGFTFTGGTDQVVLLGEDCVVARCVSKDAGGSFCVVEGDGATVASCKVSGSAGVAVSVTGAAATVARVKVSTGDDGGIAVEGPDAEVHACKVVATLAFGIAVTGDGGSIARCRVLHSGSEGGAGFVVTGDGNAIAGNLAVHCTDDGFRIEGNANAVSRSGASQCEDDGFDVEGGLGVTFQACRATRNDDAGLENGGQETEAGRCRFLANRVDVGLDGSLDASYGDFEGNVFGSGGVTVVIGLP